MSHLSLIYALTTFTISFFTGKLIRSKANYQTKINQFETIDSLRGILAMSVFICHTAVWYKYLETNRWETPTSNLFTQFGETGVTLFFMISSFLFTHKLIDKKNTPINWAHFFKKRFYRLVPLHFFLLLVILFLIGVESQWVFNEPKLDTLKSIGQWMAFGTLNIPDINKVDAQIINAGVLWSLSYEWLFYFMFPVFSLIISKQKPPGVILFISLIFILVSIQFRTYEAHHLFSFFAGSIAAFIVHFNKQKINFNHPYFSLVLIISLVGIAQFSSSSNYFCKLITAFAFTLVALGNTIFGLLKSQTLKFLGDISYSTYLTHGIILFITMQYIIKDNSTKTMSETIYWLVIFVVCPLLLLINFLTYTYIEKPFISRTTNLN